MPVDPGVWPGIEMNVIVVVQKVVRFAPPGASKRSRRTKSGRQVLQHHLPPEVSPDLCSVYAATASRRGLTMRRATAGIFAGRASKSLNPKELV